MTGPLRFERLIKASPAVVFDAFTSPGGPEAFYKQGEPGWIVESVVDLRVGGAWTIDFGPDRAHLYRHRHTFLGIVVGKRLLLSTTEFRVDGTTLEFTFTDHHGRTLMTMT